MTVLISYFNTNFMFIKCCLAFPNNKTCFDMCRYLKTICIQYGQLIELKYENWKFVQVKVIVV